MTLDTLCVGCMDNDSGDAICPKCGSPFHLTPTDGAQLPPRTMLRGQYLIGPARAHASSVITYLAWDSALRSRVLLKEYMPQGLGKRNAGEFTVQASSPACQEQYDLGLERFLEEARLLKKLSGNPNIAAVETVFRDNGTAYLVMELLEGMTLESFLESRDQTLTLESAQRILTPICDALSAVHEQGALHGNVNPSAVFLCKTGKAKLIGFGAARRGLASAATDVYGLAATFYCAITGQAPPSALDRLEEDQLQPPSKLGVGIPVSIEKALMKALSVRAVDRFQSISEFRDAIAGQKNAGAPLPPSVKAAIPAPPPRKAKSTALLALAGRLHSHKRVVPITLLTLLALVTASAALHYAGKRESVPQDQQEASQQQPPAQTDGQAQPDNQPTDDQQSKPDPAPAQPAQPVVIAKANLPAPPVDPAPDSAPVVEAPAPAIVAPAPIGYDRLLAHAEALLAHGQYPEAAEALTYAIAANPARWQAYNLLARTQLYYLNIPDEALRNYRAAIAHGGHASFRVRHDHGGEGIACSGWLNISRGRASFQANDGLHSFGSAPVKEAKKNKFVGRIEGGHAFHVRLANNQNYNFATTSIAPKAEVDFILSALN